MSGIYLLKKSESDPNISKLYNSIFYSFIKEILSIILYKGILFPSPIANYTAKIICIILRSRWLIYSFIQLLIHNY